MQTLIGKADTMSMHHAIIKGSFSPAAPCNMAPLLHLSLGHPTARMALVLWVLLPLPSHFPLVMRCLQASHSWMPKSTQSTSPRILLKGQHVNPTQKTLLNIGTWKTLKHRNAPFCKVIFAPNTTHARCVVASQVEWGTMTRAIDHPSVSKQSSSIAMRSTKLKRNLAPSSWISSLVENAIMSV